MGQHALKDAILFFSEFEDSIDIIWIDGVNGFRRCKY